MIPRKQLNRIPPVRQAIARSMLRRIRSHSPGYADLSDQQLRDESLALSFRARTGEALHRLLPEAFALAGEATARATGMRHYEVQQLASIHLANEFCIEMATGEGKTLTAVLPLYLHALYGKGAHLATANDYLAKRDAEKMGPIYEALGMSVSYVQHESSDAERSEAYEKHITYGTAAEFGFDFLRDRMKLAARDRLARQGLTVSPDQQEAMRTVMRRLHFILVDEADSIMIDDASTPLIIAAPDSESGGDLEGVYRWCAEHADGAEETIHFRHLDHQNKVELNENGRGWVRLQASLHGCPQTSVADLYEYMERAIKVQRDFIRDRNYVVDGDSVTIVDTNTGRLAVGRHWHDGIHQAIQAREGLPITPPTSAAARLTIQSLVLSYRQRAGMTGTTQSSRREFRKVYKMPVVRVPTRVPSRRRKLGSEYFECQNDKFDAICRDIARLSGQGRPVLIGSRSVVKSELLSQMVRELGVDHVVLNARNEPEEAAIVALAGETSRVTISTAMAGRGTDIELEAGVAESGGLHVIIAEMNDSRRIDRQLIGRGARQGDPGSYKIYMSADDELLDDKNRNGFLRRLLAGRAPIPRQWVLWLAQLRVSRKKTRERLSMLHHEKKRLKAIREAGLDPVLDVVG